MEGKTAAGRGLHFFPRGRSLALTQPLLGRSPPPLQIPLSMLLSALAPARAGARPAGRRPTARAARLNGAVPAATKLKEPEVAEKIEVEGARRVLRVFFWRSRLSLVCGPRGERAGGGVCFFFAAVSIVWPACWASRPHQALARALHLTMCGVREGAGVPSRQGWGLFFARLTVCGQGKESERENARRDPPVRNTLTHASASSHRVLAHGWTGHVSGWPGVGAMALARAVVLGGRALRRRRAPSAARSLRAARRCPPLQSPLTLPLAHSPPTTPRRAGV
jgi:hypothetical protein